MLDLLVAECVRSAIRPQPVLALGAAICAVGVLAGRRYRTGTDLRSNIYVAALAESGGGKDHAPEVVRRAFEAAGLERWLGGEAVASGRAVLALLEAHPCRLVQLDELGGFLQAVAGRRAPPHRAEIWSELTRLHSRAKGSYRGAGRARVLHQPCLCLYGTSTPSAFRAALEGGALADGSLSRFMLFVAENPRPPRNPAPGLATPSPALLAALRDVAGAAPPAEAGPPVPRTVPMTPQAAAAQDQRLDGEDEWAARVAGTPAASVVARLGEHAAKLALIRAVSRDPAAPEIGEEDVAWGWALAEHSARTLLGQLSRSTVDGEAEARRRTLEIVRHAGPGGLTRTQLYRRTPFLGARRDAVLAALVEEGAIEVRRLPGRTKPTLRYCAAPA